METAFLAMRENFDRYDDVFKQTTSVGQFLKQAEIDVVGVDRKGNVYAVEVAFHECALNYGGGPGTRDRVLKKSLRTMLILRAYHPLAFRIVEDAKGAGASQIHFLDELGG